MASRHLLVPGMATLLLAAAWGSSAVPSWTAQLYPVGGSGVSGKASLEATGPDSVKVWISVAGAKAGQYPWHVHSGECGKEGPPVGNAAQYPLINVPAGGTGAIEAKIAFNPPAGTTYSVNVHRSAKDLTVIACGGLRPAEMEQPDTIHQMAPRPDTTLKP